MKVSNVIELLATTAKDLRAAAGELRAAVSELASDEPTRRAAARALRDEVRARVETALAPLGAAEGTALDTQGSSVDSDKCAACGDVASEVRYVTGAGGEPMAAPCCATCFVSSSTIFRSKIGDRLELARREAARRDDSDDEVYPS